MIRDTSAQDHVIRPASARRPLRWLVVAVAVAAVLALTTLVAGGWSAGSTSVDVGRVRIAEVKRGTLVRDVSAEGRLTASNSPTLYAVAGGTVDLKVIAGDRVERGQVLAVIDSPSSGAASPRNRPPPPASRPRWGAPHSRSVRGGPRRRSWSIRRRWTTRPPRASWSASTRATGWAPCRRSTVSRRRTNCARPRSRWPTRARTPPCRARASASSSAPSGSGSTASAPSQRELLLDTMVQNTPVAMVLCDPGRHVVYSNVAARKLLNAGRRLEGGHLDALLADAPDALRDAVQQGGDGLFVIGREDEDEEDTWHLSRRVFRLNGRPHELFLLRHLTPELRRQEVRTWKKVIRVISHELNNSLAPIASLAHSGAELVRRGRHEKLGHVFGTIEERARHLEGFIRGYAHFAKLPAPRLEPIDWPHFVARLRSQIDFRVKGALPAASAHFDSAQMEQALINLLRNAHESGSAPDAVTLRVRRLPAQVAIEVGDRGSGMSEAVLANALLPFYSTKRGGTGLGLALVREIAEAHGGRLSLANREGGGLAITIVLPD